MVEKDSFNIEAYKSLRDEINRRVEIHYKLVLAKYVLVGGLFAYLITHERNLTVKLSPFLIAAAFAFLLDVVILENLGWIRNVGGYVKNNIETTPLSIVKWETFGAQPSDRWNCFTVPGYMLGTWSIGLMFFAGAFFVDLERIDRVTLFGVVLVSYLLAYSFYLIFRHLGRERPVTITHQSPIT